MKVQVTFWKSDFCGESYDKLLSILKRYSCKGDGFWFVVKANYVRAYILESDYEWIMTHIANYGYTNVNQ